MVLFSKVSPAADERVHCLVESVLARVVRQPSSGIVTALFGREFLATVALLYGTPPVAVTSAFPRVGGLKPYSVFDSPFLEHGHNMIEAQICCAVASGLSR